MNINEELVDRTKEFHQQWLANPTTQSALSLLKKHRESFVNLVSANVSNTAISDATIRHYAINIRNTDAIIALLTNTEKFVEKLTVQSDNKEQ